MEEFKGTKGEWRYIEKQVPSSGGLICEIHEFVGELQGCIIGRVTTNNYEARKANAKLIAAAPELLKALQKVVRWSAHFPKAMNEELVEANEAIQKALG